MNKTHPDIKKAIEDHRDKNLVRIISNAKLVYDERFDVFKLCINIVGRRKPYIIPIKYKHDRPSKTPPGGDGGI
jgi:hypothetical protein